MKRLLCIALSCAFAARAIEPPPPPSPEPSREVAPPPPAPEPSHEVEPPAAREAPQWTRRVHLLGSDDRVELLRRVPGMKDVVVCRTPCGVPVGFDPSDQFVLGGREILESAPFTLKLSEEDATLHVSPGTQGSRIVGGVLAVGGGAVAFGGAITLAVSAAFGNVFCDGDPQCAAGNADRRSTALFVTAGGLVIGVLGAILLWTGGRPTSFTSEP
ncbi:MAG TPA: hypothetical protein VGH20_18150 [Myxococcales bacterium]|jgi:hypothetical protein